MQRPSSPLPAPRASRMVLAPLALALAVATTGAGCGGGKAAGAAGGLGLVVLPGSNPGHPDLAERPYFHDFGRVPDGEVASHVFRLENRSQAPIGITRVNPSCGCTVPSLSAVTPAGERIQALDDPTGRTVILSVPPGGVAELELRIATREIHTKNMDKLLSTQVVTDSDVTPFIQLETHILVENPFQMTPDRLDLGRVPTSGGASGKTEIAALKDLPHRIGRVLEAPDWIETELTEGQVFGRTVWTLSVSLVPPLPLGRRTARLLLETLDGDGRPYRPLPVDVIAQVVEDVQVDPARLVLVAEPGSREVAEAVVELHSLLPGQRLAVTGVELAPENEQVLEASFEAATPPSRSGRAERWTIRLRTRPPIDEEILEGTLVVRLDDPQTPVKEVPFVLHLR